MRARDVFERAVRLFDARWSPERRREERMDRKIIEAPVDQVVPYQDNPRHNEDAVDAVAESIRRFGFRSPIVVDEDMVVLAGHTRLKAARKLGLSTVPVLVAEGLSEEDRKAYRLADNKTGELASWDLGLLEKELEGLEGMELLGFDAEVDEDIGETLLEDVQEDDFDVSADRPIRCDKGDVWLLGEHRLMCGDSTDPYAVAVLAGGEPVDLLLTDPPYNVGLGYGMDEEEAKILRRRTDGLTIDNDQWSNDEEFEDFLTAALKSGAAVLKPGGVFYVWHAHNWSLPMFSAAKRAGLQVRQCLVWNKNTFALGRQDYQWKHEPCIYGWKAGAAHYFIDDRRQSTVFEDPRLNIKAMKKEEMRELLEAIFSDKISTTILNEDKPSRSCEHPTMKPVKLMARQIVNSTRQGETVLDLFGGSGSTLIACEQTGRRCLTMELDPKFCDVIIDRWERLTGLEAVKQEEGTR